MTMTPIEQRFEQLASQGRKAFMPFVTAGDPSLEATEAVIRALDKAGCSFCEIGFPYSDPIADGPVIQASYTRALENKLRIPSIFEMTARVSREISMPLVGMVSFAIIFRQGVDHFLSTAKASGISGLIVPDLLVDDAEELSNKFAEHEVNLIQLITPTTSRQRALRIAKSSSGFIYYVSVTGITGERRELPTDLVENVSWLREQIDLPVCIGFGISSPEHVQQLAPVSDGLIVGSAIVRRIQENADQPLEQMAERVSEFATELVDSMNSVS